MNSNTPKLMPSQSELMELFVYEPETGLFRHRAAKYGCIAGDVAGYVQDGYCRISIGGKSHALHRLAFVYMTGQCPALVDHDDQVKTNNVWLNLKVGDKQRNAVNIDAPNAGRVRNLPRGVYKSRNKFLSKMSVKGVTVIIGRFCNAKEAGEAYARARRELIADLDRAHSGQQPATTTDFAPRPGCCSIGQNRAPMGD